jgi:Zn-dependent protease/CBS domain-containing protein
VTGLAVGRIAGIEIRLHVSWILIVAFVTLVLGSELEALDPGVQGPLAYLLGGTAAIAFLLSVLAHELAHALVARRAGAVVPAVTLLFFGGNALAEVPTLGPRAELVVAAVGPAVSVALGLATLILALLASAAGGLVGELAGDLLLVVAVLNLLLGAVNLIPAVPLDGARIVAAVVWWATGSPRTGLRAASLAGRLVGWAGLAGGLLVAFLGDPTTGLMILLVGWLVGRSSRFVEGRILMEDLAQGLVVGQAMERDVPQIAPQLTLDTFAERLLLSGDEVGLPVVHDHEVVGLVGLAQVRRVGRNRWATTRAVDVMVRPPELPVFRPDDPLWEAMERLTRSGLDAAPVVEGSQVAGIVSRRAIAALLQIRRRAGAPV